MTEQETTEQEQETTEQEQETTEQETTEQEQETTEQETTEQEQETTVQETTDNPPPHQDSEVYGSPEQYDYSTVELPEGITLDTELTQEFEPIAKKLNLSNKSANELMKLAVKLTQKNVSKFPDYSAAVQQAKKDSYVEMLNKDKELNVNNEAQYGSYLNVATQGLKAVATPKFIELLKAEGLTHHPEFIKTFHKIGQLCASEKIPDVQYPSGQKEIDPADVLYGNA